MRPGAPSPSVAPGGLSEAPTQSKWIWQSPLIVERVPTADGLSLAVDLLRCCERAAGGRVAPSRRRSSKIRHAWDVPPNACTSELHGCRVRHRGHGDSDWADGRYDMDRLWIRPVGRALIRRFRPPRRRDRHISGQLDHSREHLAHPAGPWPAPLCWLTSLREWRWTAPTTVVARSCRHEGFDSLRIGR